MSDKSSSPGREWRLAYDSSDVDEEIGMDCGHAKRGQVDVGGLIQGGGLEDGEMVVGGEGSAEVLVGGERPEEVLQDGEYLGEVPGENLIDGGEIRTAEDHLHLPPDSDKSYMCQHCGKCFAVKFNLDQHQRVHSGERPFMCAHCGQRFVYSSNLARHAHLHAASSTEKSLECGQYFGDTACLSQHNRAIKPHSCQHCGKCFTVKSSLTRHLKIHSVDQSNAGRCSGDGTSPPNARPYVCGHCRESFAVQSSLTRHYIKVHCGDQPNGGKSFNDDIISPSDTPYVCEHCSKSFAVKSSLVRHLKFHLGEKSEGFADCKTPGELPRAGKPYVCAQCGNSFAVKSSLTRHLKIHLGDKLYKCEHCGRCFTYNSNLKAHLLIHSRGRLRIRRESTVKEAGNGCTKDSGEERMNDDMSSNVDGDCINTGDTEHSSLSTTSDLESMNNVCAVNTVTEAVVKAVALAGIPGAIMSLIGMEIPGEVLEDKGHEHCGNWFAYNSNSETHILMMNPMDQSSHESTVESNQPNTYPVMISVPLPAETGEAAQNSS